MVDAVANKVVPPTISHNIQRSAVLGVSWEASGDPQTPSPVDDGS